MFWIISWTVILIIYTILAIIQLSDKNLTKPEVIIIVTGFIAVSSTLLKQLYQNNLTFYLYWTKLKNWIRNYPSKWQLTIRYDGKFDRNLIREIKSYLSQRNKIINSVKIHHETSNSINFTVEETLNVYLDYQLKETNRLEYDTIDIQLSSFEIGSNNSKKKLDSLIIPFFNNLQSFLKPDNTSYVLNINFIKGNPFFALFISHLKVSLIDSFYINLLIDNYSESRSKVTISKENIIINAVDLHSLKELANDFIYLSINVKQYLKLANSG